MNANHPPEPVGMPELILTDPWTSHLSNHLHNYSAVHLHHSAIDSGKIPARVIEDEAYRKALLPLSVSHRPSLDNIASLPPALAHPARTSPSLDNPTANEPNTPNGPDQTQPPGTKPQLMGRRYHQLPDGRTYEELVDVSAHQNHGHSGEAKVRPAAGTASSTTGYPPAEEQMLISKTSNPSGNLQDTDKSPGSGLFPLTWQENVHRAAGHEIEHSHAGKTASTDMNHVDCDASSSQGTHLDHQPHPYNGDGTPVNSFKPLELRGNDQGTNPPTLPRGREPSRSASQLVKYWERMDNAAGQVAPSPERVRTGTERPVDVSHRPPHQELRSGHSKTAESATASPEDSTFVSGVLRTADFLPGVSASMRGRDTAAGEPVTGLFLQEKQEYQASDQNGSRYEGGSPRNLTVNSTGSTSIEFRFKRAMSNMEHLLDEAVALAKQIAEPKSDHSTTSDARSSITGNECGLDTPNTLTTPASSCYHAPQEKSAKQTVACTHRHRLYKRHRSTPGISSRDRTVVDAPNTPSTSNKSKTDSKQPKLQGHANQGNHSLSASSDRPHLEPHSRRPDRQPDEIHHDLPSEPGCFFGKRFVRKSRSRRSCGLPLIPHRICSQRDAGPDEIQHDGTRPRTELMVRPPAEPIIEGSEPNSTNVLHGLDGALDGDGTTTTGRGPLHATDTVSEPELTRLTSSEPEPPPQPNRIREKDPQCPSTFQSRLTLRRRSHVHPSTTTADSPPCPPPPHRHHNAPLTPRSWPTARKRLIATSACISTTGLGIVIGIYAGLVPSIQYWITDLRHYALLGNVLLYLGLALSTFVAWPLPLLHGRRPYVLGGLAAAVLLLIPQAVAVSDFRSPYVATWRWMLLGSRAAMGVAMGVGLAGGGSFVGVLMDLFGASLMSGNPHQEVVDEGDLRRRGGGMGVWLGFWTWCWTGSLGVGFAVGAKIIDRQNPAWGFYVSMGVLAMVALLNALCPEVRSPRGCGGAGAWGGGGGDEVMAVEGRGVVAGGELMMHRVGRSPGWWGQEVYHGVVLSLAMLRQPGFMVMAVYTGWIYAQIVLVIVLLGSLASKYYELRSPLVGLCVLFMSIGAFVAIPFQKANLFSRGRHHQDTLDTPFSWTSHLMRRAIFCIFLPIVGIAYTVASAGPPIPVAVPTLMAALIGNLSGLAISECNGLIMETFDTSDLPPSPGVVGRDGAEAHSDTNDKGPEKHANHCSTFPRVTAGFAVCHTIGFVLAAVATAVGGQAQAHLGQREATGVVAGILFILTLLLLAVLIRFKDVQMIPTCKTLEMERWTELRRESLIRRRSEARSCGGTRNATVTAKAGEQGQQDGTTNAADPDHPDLWRPILLGNPSCKMRRVNVLELGALTRWTEIRKANRLIDERAAAHLNRAALEQATGVVGAATAELVRRVSRRSRRSPSPRPRTPGVCPAAPSAGGGGGEPGMGLLRPLTAGPPPITCTTAAGTGAGRLGVGASGAAPSYSLPEQVGGANHGVRGQTVVEEGEEREGVECCDDDFVSFVSDRGDDWNRTGRERGAELGVGVARGGTD